MALNALKHFDLARHAPDSVERRHLEVEAVKIAWVLRNRYIADPTQVDVPVADLLSDKTADMIAGLIDPQESLQRPGIAGPHGRLAYRLSDRCRP